MGSARGWSRQPPAAAGALHHGGPLKSSAPKYTGEVVHAAQPVHCRGLWQFFSQHLAGPALPLCQKRSRVPGLLGRLLPTTRWQQRWRLGGLPRRRESPRDIGASDRRLFFYTARGMAVLRSDR